MKHWWIGMVIVAACGGGDDGGPTFSDEHPRIYLQANRDRLASAFAAGGPAAERYKDTVDLWMGGEEIWGFDAWQAALVGQLTGDPSYCKAAVAEIDKQVRSAESDIASGSAPVVADDSYLYVGDMIGDLAIVYDWCNTDVGDRRRAWLAYANQAVSNVWNPDGATWGGKAFPWSGWATDDPSNNYHYSFLRATMLLGLAAHGEIEGAPDWLATFHDQRITNGLVPVFEQDLVGGGSREGTGYGVAMRTLFGLYDLWEGSTGEALADRTMHTRASMLAMMHQTVPTLDRIAPTGDHSRDSEALFFDFHRNYLQELVHLYPDEPAAGAAQTLLAMSTVPEMDNRFMFVYDFLYANDKVASKPLDTLGTAYHAPGIGQLYARSSWSQSATWINLIAGPYDQSHAHQDQGSLMIYKGGWLAYDANVASKSGLRQEVDAHGLVRIVSGGNSVDQRSGTSSPLVALHRGPGWLHAAADITPAYKGASAVQKVQREVVFIEPDTIVVYDRVTSNASTQQVWQLVMPTSPAIAGPRATVTASGHTLAIDRVAPAQATSAVHSLASDDDFTGGFRLETTVAGGDQRFLHVLSIDGSVSSITPEAEGATVALAAGGTAKVVFTRDSIGAKLTIGGTTTTLGAGVDSLP